jgi:hypothetical protein
MKNIKNWQLNSDSCALETHFHKVKFNIIRINFKNGVTELIIYILDG